MLSNNEKWTTKAKFLATQARDTALHYQHSHVGYNYRMSNVCASIGRGQMEVLPLRVYQRRKNYTFYKRMLNGISEIEFQREPNEDYFSNRWLTAVLLLENESKNTSEQIRLALEKENIESRPLWKPMHMQPIFANFDFYGDGTSENLFKRGLCLPSGSNLSEHEIRSVVKKIKSCFTLSLVE
jgi:dTDP-4-amino-4,6-dideoxygalactose transaminase